MRKHRTDLAYEEVLDLQDNENFTHTKKAYRGITTHPGFQHLQLNKSSKYRRNAVFFCQIPLSFTLYMLYNYGGLYLIGR